MDKCIDFLHAAICSYYHTSISIHTKGRYAKCTIHTEEKYTKNFSCIIGTKISTIVEFEL